MRKGMVFFLGMIVGGALTFFVSLFLLFWFSSSSTSDSDEEGKSPLTLFEQPADVIETASFEVQEVLSDGNAIAKSQDKDLDGYYTDPIVLLLVEESNPYYDKQIVKVPKGKCAYRVGVCQYKEYSDTKTLPVVQIMDK